MGHKEVGLGASIVEDFEDISEHTLFDLGQREGAHGGNELQGTMHQMYVPLRVELYSINETTLCVLSSGDKGH